MVMRIQLLALLGLILMAGVPAIGQGSRGIPRTPDGRPDLTGNYEANTITPVERAEKFGSRRALTDQEAVEIQRTQAARNEEGEKPSDPNRAAPKASADGASIDQRSGARNFVVATDNGVAAVVA